MSLHSIVGSGESFVAALAALVHLAIRLLRTGAFEVLLAKLGRKPVPKAWLPWLALALGTAAALLDARLGGAAWSAAWHPAFEGLLAGALAVAGYEGLKSRSATSVRSAASTPSEKIDVPKCKTCDELGATCEEAKPKPPEEAKSKLPEEPKS